MCYIIFLFIPQKQGIFVKMVPIYHLLNVVIVILIILIVIVVILWVRLIRYGGKQTKEGKGTTKRKRDS